MPIHEFRLDLPDPVDVVFDWHRRQGGLPRMLPPWQPTKIAQEAGSLRDGMAILRFPAGRKWVARHIASAYVDGELFADTLTSRPFIVPIKWNHRHEFVPNGSGTTLIDRVDTVLPSRLLRPMFAYRHRQLSHDLASHRWAAQTPRLTIAMTGSTGLVGSALAPFLTTGGHRVIRLVRSNPANQDERLWDPLSPDPTMLDGVDAVAHLAGARIAGRFTADHKKAIRSSRIEPTRLLAQAAADAGVATFVCASAIGYYGPDRGDTTLDESSEPGKGFVADVVAAWEEAAHARAAEIRTVSVRTGIVQSPQGGALKAQRWPYFAGLGGRLGSGDQWLSWIGIDDLVDIYHRVLLMSDVHGPVNAVAPSPVRQHEYAKMLGRVLRRPVIVPTPRAGPRLIFGAEAEREVIAASQRVSPSVLRAVGHESRFPELEPALRHLFGRTT